MKQIENPNRQKTSIKSLQHETQHGLQIQDLTLGIHPKDPRK